MRVLVVNAGSSSLKLSVLDGDRLVSSTKVDSPSIDPAGAQSAIRELAGTSQRIDAVGHRIVHGGSEFSGPVVIDDGVRRRLESLSDLAPLHQPKSLEALKVVSELLPEVPAVASFDTAFHATIPPPAATYALPAEWRKRWNLRRFGFHGLSHAYASRHAATLMGQPVEELRVVTCHLGAGASATAVLNGRSVDTTMGFTPLEGLVMATRSGSVDPGLVLWLEEHVGMAPSQLAASLENQSGLLGLAGSADMRAVLAAEARSDPDASLAIGVYLHRLIAAISSMAAAMNGMNVLVFTGGVGERSASIRGRATQGLGFLGVTVDLQANEAADSRSVPDVEITSAGASVRTFVIEAREDLQIASEVRQVLGG